MLSRNIYLNRFVLLCLLVICMTAELRPREYDSHLLGIKFNLSTTPGREFYMPARRTIDALLCVTYTPWMQPQIDRLHSSQTMKSLFFLLAKLSLGTLFCNKTIPIPSEEAGILEPWPSAVLSKLHYDLTSTRSVSTSCVPGTFLGTGV